MKLLIVGHSAVRLLITLKRDPRGEKLPKRLPNGLGAARSQSSSSVSRSVPELNLNYLPKRKGKAGKRSAGKTEKWTDRCC